jgi:hypothetical protein
MLSAKGIKNPRSFGCVFGANGIAAFQLYAADTDGQAHDWLD